MNIPAGLIAKLIKFELLSAPTADPVLVEDKVREYQVIHGLKPDGIAGAVTAWHMEHRFCSTPDTMQEAASLCQWPMKNPTVAVADYTPGLSVADQREAMNFVFNETAKLCGLSPIFLADNNGKRANITLYVKNLGGRGGTLAQAQLPCGQIDPTTGLWLQTDSQDFWGIFDGPSTNGRTDWRRVFWHEFLHNAGISHLRLGNLMAAMYSDSIFRPQADDTAELRTRYGLPANPNPTPPPTPTPVPPTPGTTTAVESLRDLMAKWVGDSDRYRVTKN